MNQVEFNAIKELNMGEVYIVEACRSAIGKRGKGLAGLKPADLLGKVH